MFYLNTQRLLLEETWVTRDRTTALRKTERRAADQLSPRKIHLFPVILRFACRQQPSNDQIGSAIQRVPLPQNITVLHRAIMKKSEKNKCDPKKVMILKNTRWKIDMGTMFWDRGAHGESNSPLLTDSL